jgi:transcriptional regulator with XRE-family HTH domain
VTIRCGFTGRHRKGMSRTELAAKAGISKARLSQLLSSEANPTLAGYAAAVAAGAGTG